MSKPSVKTEAEQILAGIGRGEGVPSGWAVDFSKNPPVFPIEDQEEPGEDQIEEHGGDAED